MSGQDDNKVLVTYSRSKSLNCLMNTTWIAFLTAPMDIQLFLKKYLGGHIDLETLVVLEKIFEFRERFDQKLLTLCGKP